MSDNYDENVNYNTNQYNSDYMNNKNLNYNNGLGKYFNDGLRCWISSTSYEIDSR